jgi:hypothetical protein
VTGSMTQIVHMGAPMRFKFRGSYRFLLITGLAILVLVPLALFVSAQETLPPIQFNVPYRCTDGTTYIIQRCETGPQRRGLFLPHREKTASSKPSPTTSVRR